MKRLLVFGGTMVTALAVLAACDDTLANLETYEQRAAAYCERSDAAYLADAASGGELMSEQVRRADTAARIAYNCGPYPAL